MRAKLPELSERLARLPVRSRRKLPVRYANVINAAGRADSATLDSVKVHQIARTGCADCAVSRWAIGSPSSAGRAVFSSGPI